MADAVRDAGHLWRDAAGRRHAQRAKALEKALEIDDALAEAYACRGCVRSVFDWSWTDAERDFLRAIELNPRTRRRTTGTRSTTSCRAGDSTLPTGASPRAGARPSGAGNQDEPRNEVILRGAVRRCRRTSCCGRFSWTIVSGWRARFWAPPTSNKAATTKRGPRSRPRYGSAAAHLRFSPASAIFTGAPAIPRGARGVLDELKPAVSGTVCLARTARAGPRRPRRARRGARSARGGGGGARGGPGMARRTAGVRESSRRAALCGAVEADGARGCARPAGQR